jgi:dihydrofolate reductase
LEVVLYIAASLDGYIAGPNGEIDWLDVVEGSGEDYGYNEFYQSVDAIISGSKTYDLVAGFPEWPYPGKPTFVLTRRPLASDRDDVYFLSNDVVNALDQVRDQGLQRAWLLGGGELVRSFLREDLIDEFIIAIIPVILGQGIPLFPPETPRRDVELVESQHYRSGMVMNRYLRRRAG